MLSIGIHIQCFAIKTAVAFFEWAAKSTMLAGIRSICHRTQTEQLSHSISSCHCIVLNMAPSTSIEMHKIVVCWCFEQHKTAFEISVLFPAVQSEPWLRFCNLDYVGIMAKSILSLVSGAALTFSTMAILNIYVLWILHYNWMSCRSFAAQDKDVSLEYDDMKLRLFCSFSRQLYQQ